MHDASLAPAGRATPAGHADHPDTPAVGAPARLARQGDAAALAQALQDSGRDTLATFAAYEAALPGLVVPQRDELNPPLWELGHIGWFHSWWLGRFPAHAQGVDADPDAPRLASSRADADHLYNSSLVPHHTRWQLPLPDAAATRADLQQQLDETLALLARLPPASTDDRSLYFFRLALLHEDMHHEAALYMAQALGIAIEDGRWQPAALPPPPPALPLAAGHWPLGSAADAGFAFDNELCAHGVELPATILDAQAVRWAEFLPFVEVGGYADERWWTRGGRVWLAASGARAPRYLQREGATWLQNRQGRWQPLRPEEAACHLTQHEALAWCRWAGRRLPTEAEWERAALTAGPAFRWGDVWEWTASPFAPYPGFRAHPYRDYSAPWFDGRPVLRGASFMTQPRLRHPRYRNYFPPARNDVPAGFRSCAM
ncbi:MAG: selenoneine synthase SenA [Rubrivivax sp.]|nr:selenoneine synthase SenA [Rubrivivax sp.]